MDGAAGSKSVASHEKAGETLPESLRWYEQQPETTATSILLLKLFWDLAHKKRYSNLTKTSVKYYFTTFTP